MSSKRKFIAWEWAFIFCSFRQAINFEETAVGLNKRRLIQSAVVKELVRVCINIQNLFKLVLLHLAHRSRSETLATREKQTEYCDVCRFTR